MAGTAARPNEDRPMLGILLMLLTYFGFSCVDVSAKTLVIAGIPAFQVAFFRYFGPFVISTGLVARQGISLSRFGTDNKWLVLLRGFLLMITTVNNFIAVKYLPLTLTSTIMFSAPIIICALSGPVLGEKVGMWRWGAICIGFIGVLIAMRPFGADFHWAILLSFSNACIFAIYSLMTRKLAGKVSSDTMQLYAGLIGTVTLAPFAFAYWQNPETIWGWVIFAAIGFFGWASHETLTRAHGYAEASTLTPFQYTLIVYMGVWGYFLFDNLPDRWTLLGALVIAAAGLFISLRERRLAKRPIPSGPSERLR